MPTFRRLCLTALIAMMAATALVTAPRAHAQQRGDVNDDEPIRLRAETLTRSSEAVVLAHAVRSESFWNDDRTAILTRVTLRVDETLLGTSAAETDVIIPGGRVGNVIHDVSDMPVFSPGDEAIVFVERHAASGMNVVNGGAQGKLDIVTNPITREKRVLGAEGLFSTDVSVPAGTGAPAGAAPADGSAEDRSAGGDGSGLDALAPGADRTLTLEAFKRALRGAAPRQ
ncbi:MAG: hypothetical protein COV99_05760 [Bacteroidetes bacterium CG12_big_fil_rev_8_21_14_0_65_60_17]|nr:MAG: hypothetical protein COV99_05760 [Bacteroidetes bacterium CG12_big_fil_rev_8_21_14_0_65_60_17]